MLTRAWEAERAKVNHALVGIRRGARGGQGTV